MATWTDPTPSTSTRIRATHINELRRTVLRNRYKAHLFGATWSDGPVVTTHHHIRAAHFTELHDAMTPYLGTLNWSYGSAPVGGGTRHISVRDLNDLRNWCDQFSTGLGLPTGPDPAFQGVTSFAFDPTTTPMASIDGIWVSDLADLTQPANAPPLWVRSEVSADGSDDISSYYSAYQSAFGLYQAAYMPVFPLLVNKFARGCAGHYNDGVSDGFFSNAFIDYFAPRAASFMQAVRPYGATDVIIWNEPNDTTSSIYLDARVFASLLWHCSQQFQAAGLNLDLVMGGLLWQDSINHGTATQQVVSYLTAMVTWLRKNQRGVPWDVVNVHPHNCGDPNGQNGFSQGDMNNLRDQIDAVFNDAERRPVYAGEWGPTHAGAGNASCLTNAYTYLRNAFDAMFLFQHPNRNFPSCCGADGSPTCPYASQTPNGQGANNDYGLTTWTFRAPPPGGQYQLFTIGDHCAAWQQLSNALASTSG